ncbi:MAG TPA: GNAT family protein [Chitinophagaceae bacterium]|nr:GNAT family protein [Chitinophagaceae bacterium]
MHSPLLSVREIQHHDIQPLSDYWFQSDPEFLVNMGVDLSKIPVREKWEQMLEQQIRQSYREKQSYCIIWLLENEPIGHSNINRIIFGEEAYMHLHIWKKHNRTKGMGLQFMNMTLPYFFRNMQLKKLCCEPYALNPAPNRTMEKLGFEFIREYITVPGWINYEQKVKHWELTYEKFKSLYEMGT